MRCTSWKLRRILVGAKQADVARLAGISVQRLRAIELGRREPTQEEVRRLAEVLGDLAAQADRMERGR